MCTSQRGGGVKRLHLNTRFKCDLCVALITNQRWHNTREREIKKKETNKQREKAIEEK